ncbi:MAG: hypothetical protein PHW09_03565 [Desulfovibrio desulfuricans]|nr:hypothetical protein [Desulfovibrio desulfuricans]
MSVSDVSGIERATRLTSSAQNTLERAQGDFSRQIQSALSALDGQAESVRSAVAPVVAQVTQAVESVLAQLQAAQTLSGTSAVSATPVSTALPPQAADPQTMAQKTQAGVRDYLLPGEPGAGLPANYLKSPLYQEWLAQKPQRGDNVAEFGRALTTWQKANPYYVDPDRFDTFDGYLSAVQTSTVSDNLPAQADPTRYTSFLSSYYGPSATANPWGERLGQVKPQEMVEWSDGLRAQYEHALAAQRSLQALEASGLLGSGNT